MPISFSAAERLAITRRQVRILLENEGFQKTVSSFDSQKAQLLQVDDGNAKFYNFYNSIVQSYEDEIKNINGIISDTYLASDIVSAAQTPSIAPFFPSSPTPAYAKNIPLIQDGPHTNNKVKGFFHPVGQDILREENLLSGLSNLITYFLSVHGVDNTTTVTLIPAGPVSGLVVDVAPPVTGFVVNDLVYISNGSNNGVYKIISINTSGNKITIDSVIVAQNDIAVGATVSNQNTTLQTAINNYISFWKSKLDNQKIALTNQNDDRTPQSLENTTALTNVNNALSIIDPWLLAPNYTSSGLSPIQTLISNRIPQVSTRITQITTALGSTSNDALTQSGDNYITNIPNNPYFNRYKWLNFRINRASGSLRRFYAADQAKNAVQGLLNDNNSIKAEYDSYFLTKPIIFNDGSDILHIKNLTGLSNGDIITVVSETQPEITRTIVQLIGTTQIKLNASVPTIYKLEDIARVFKTL